MLRTPASGWERNGSARCPAELQIGDVAIVHAAPGDLWRAPMPDAPHRELEAAYRPLRASTAVYGHIHCPFTRDVNAIVIANTGSAGMPWDGDK
jgi:predicted phosphodiesterase